MRRRIVVFIAIIIIPFLILIFDHYILNEDIHICASYDISQEWNYICEHQQDYPISLLKLALKNSETISFVYYYPFQQCQKEFVHSPYKVNNHEIPLFLQWDQRWGYQKYGHDYIAVNGSGPACLAMVTSYLKQDTKFNPYYIAQFAYQKGYYCCEGTSCKLMDDGATQLGLHVEEIILDENIIQSYLKNNQPIICYVSKGIFTDEDHFIVLRNYKDKKYFVNDPTSVIKSQREYDFDEISSQMKRLWVYSP